VREVQLVPALLAEDNFIVVKDFESETTFDIIGELFVVL
jgi:hypothetical protein